MSDPDSLLGRLRTEIVASVYQRRLGIEIKSVGDGESEISLPLRRSNVNRSGNLHGGAHASLMLSAASLAAASTEREPADGKTLSPRALSLSYLGAARNTGVNARATLLRRGRDVAHMGVEVADDAGGPIASGKVTIAIHEEGLRVSSKTSSGHERCAAVYGRLALRDGRPVQGSPFLEESGLIAFDEHVDAWNSLLIPVAKNERADGFIDDGAVVGLVDNCGSLAAYTAEGVEREMLGATLSMSVAFAAPARGPVVGSGRLLAHLGSALTSEVEIWSPDDGRLRACGLVCYRIPGQRLL